MTKKQLLRINPLRAGQVGGTFWGILTLFLIPLLLLHILPTPADAELNLGTLLVAPLFNAMGGFLLGALSAAIYNLTVRITGGLEFIVADEPVMAQQVTPPR